MGTPSSPSATIWLVLAVAHQTVITVRGDAWWVTACVAVGAALLGSFAGAGASYRVNVALEERRRRALAEIRRKAKIYTPIREELVALRRALGEDRHLSMWGIQRERPQHQLMVRPPVLSIWRDLVEDGRAKTSASAYVRTALDRLEVSVDRFNTALKALRAIFEQRGAAITSVTGFTPTVRNWHEAYAAAIFRNGIGSSQTFSTSPGSAKDTAATPEAQAFAAAWNSDVDVEEAKTRLASAEVMILEDLDDALAALDHAMSKIADKYEHEPLD